MSQRRFSGKKRHPKIPYRNIEVSYIPHIHEEWEFKGDADYKAEKRSVSYWNRPQFVEGECLYVVFEWD